MDVHADAEERAATEHPKAGSGHGIGPSPLLHLLGLAETPFPVVPDATHFFQTERMAHTLSEILDAVCQRKGFIAVTGDVGLGKSTLSRALMRIFKEQSIRVSLVLNSFLQGIDLLRAITTDFGLESGEHDSMSTLMESLNGYLLQEFKAGYNCVIMIDDTQNLSLESLEMIRQISNLETETDKLVQIILIGQTEFETTLYLPNMRQLHSRLALHKRLSPLNYDELVRFVLYKLDQAGNSGQVVVTRGALRVLFKETHGNPRQIGRLMDRCLYALVAYRTQRIDRGIMRRAAGELNAELLPTRGRRSWNGWQSVFRVQWLILVCLILLIGLTLTRPDHLASVVTTMKSLMDGELKESATDKSQQEIEISRNGRPAAGEQRLSSRRSEIRQFLAAYGLEHHSNTFERALGNNDFTVLQQKVKEDGGWRLLRFRESVEGMKGRSPVLLLESKKGSHHFLFWKPRYPPQEVHLLTDRAALLPLIEDLKRAGFDPGPEQRWGNTGVLRAIARYQSSLGRAPSGVIDEYTYYTLHHDQDRSER
ncbi:MAG: AAA family ATPase [Magnetococcales bacterium]|nr:AAA family ATPase [Magnetococcales bacterium]